MIVIVIITLRLPHPEQPSRGDGGDEVTMRVVTDAHRVRVVHLEQALQLARAGGETVHVPVLPDM